MHLGVTVRAKRVACALELAAQLGEVVDLPVLYHGARVVLVADRLIAAGEVDDREAARRKADGAVEMHAAAVGAAMDERIAHRGQAIRIGRADR